MGNNQQLTTQETGTKAVSQFLNQKNVLEKFSELLGDRASAFITSVISAVNANQLLQNATQVSIYNAALSAAAMNLPINNNLGFAYIVPYENSYKDSQGKWIKKIEAQFQIGYKGIKQLATRSGQYKLLHAKEIYQGQYVKDNSFVGFHFEWDKKESGTIIGYASYFQLLTGQESIFFMTNEEIEKHAKKYSKTYAQNKGRWVEDYDKMARKTVSKLHLNNGEAPLSIEMQRAFISDQSVVRNFDTMEVDYVDNSKEPLLIEILDASEIESKLKISSSKEEINILWKQLSEEQQSDFEVMFNEKEKELQ